MNRLKSGLCSSWIAVFAGRSLCWAPLWSFHNIGHVLFWMWSLTWNCHKNPFTVHHRANVQNGSTETASLVYLKRPCRASVSVWWWFVSCFSESLVTLIIRDEIKTYLRGTFLDYLTQHFWVKLSNTKLSLHSREFPTLCWEKQRSGRTTAELTRAVQSNKSNQSLKAEARKTTATMETPFNHCVRETHSRGHWEERHPVQ